MSHANQNQPETNKNKKKKEEKEKEIDEDDEGTEEDEISLNEEEEIDTRRDKPTKIDTALRFSLPLLLANEQTLNIDYALLKEEISEKVREVTVEAASNDLHQLQKQALEVEDISANRMTSVIQKIEQMNSKESSELGYNLHDSFIDDSDAASDNKFQSLETHHGGFFLNRGPVRTKRKFQSDDEDAKRKKRKIVPDAKINSLDAITEICVAIVPKTDDDLRKTKKKIGSDAEKNLIERLRNKYKTSEQVSAHIVALQNREKNLRRRFESLVRKNLERMEAKSDQQNFAWNSKLRDLLLKLCEVHKEAISCRFLKDLFATSSFSRKKKKLNLKREMHDFYEELCRLLPSSLGIKTLQLSRVASAARFKSKKDEAKRKSQKLKSTGKTSSDSENSDLNDESSRSDDSNRKSPSPVRQIKNKPIVSKKNLKKKKSLEKQTIAEKKDKKKENKNKKSGKKILKREDETKRKKKTEIAAKSKIKSKSKIDRKSKEKKKFQAKSKKQSCYDDGESSSQTFTKKRDKVKSAVKKYSSTPKSADNKKKSKKKDGSRSTSKSNVR